jgi:hypothetical protein
VPHSCEKDTGDLAVLSEQDLKDKGRFSNGVGGDDKTSVSDGKTSVSDGVMRSLSLIEQHLTTLEKSVQQILDTVSSERKLSEYPCAWEVRREEVDKGRIGGGLTQRKDCLSSPPPTRDIINQNFCGVVAAENAGKEVLTSGTSALATSSVPKWLYDLV